jgi:hypothetical protein
VSIKLELSPEEMVILAEIADQCLIASEVAVEVLSVCREAGIDLDQKYLEEPAYIYLNEMVDKGLLARHWDWNLLQDYDRNTCSKQPTL